VRCSLMATDDYGSFHAVFTQQGSDVSPDWESLVRTAPDASLQRYANRPLVSRHTNELPTLLTNHLQATLPDYMLPQTYVFLDAIPLTPNGKVDRRALPAPDSGRSDLSEAYVAPRNETETVLARIWADVLRVDKVGVNDDFFRLGGQSLLATQVASHIQDAFGIEVPLRNLFEAKTVAQLAVVVEGHVDAMLEQLPDEDTAALLKQMDETK
jgi:acyl carrier protein